MRGPLDFLRRVAKGDVSFVHDAQVIILPRCLDQHWLDISDRIQDVHVRQSSPIATNKNGADIGTPSSGIDWFPDIPFAQPPTGIRPPQPRTQGLSGGSFDASKSAAACPYFAFQDDDLDLSDLLNSIVRDIVGELVQSPIGQVAINQNEDCLTFAVERPAGTTADSKLPVVYWIYGEGFEAGW